VTPAAIGLLTLSLAAAQEPSPSTAIRVVTAARVEEAPRLDGVLDDPVWTAATPITEFLQKDPEEGQRATEDTVVRIVYNGDSLFLGILCRDSQPDRIVATELGRDRELSKDDNISILLDTFHDHRNAFQFSTNALGARYDARVTEEGRNVDLNWDDKWDVAAHVGADGWAVEIEIPFKTLRTAGGGDQIWGLDVQRMLRRRNELSYLQNYRRDFNFLDVSKAGHLAGLTSVPEGLRFRLKPFGVAGVTENRLTDPERTINESSVGVDGKWRLTSALTADFTVNPDFAQAEVDEQIVNLTRFPAFFPERREFFRESAGMFEFGTALGITGQTGRDLIGFFSRRIGLAQTGEVIPIIAGGRVTGKVAGFEIAALDMQTQDFDSDLTRLHLPGSNFAVARVKRDIFSRSNYGAIVTNRQSGVEGDRSTMGGIDATFVAWENLRIRTFLTKSDTPRLVRAAAAEGRTADEWAGRASFVWNTDRTLAEAEYLDIGEDYNAEVGFVPRRDIRRTIGAAGIRRRPPRGPIRQVVARSRIEYIEDQDNVRQGRILHFPTFEALFHAGDRVILDFHTNFELLPDPFRITPDGITIPPGEYRGRDWVIAWESSPGRRVWGTPLARYRRTTGFYDGNANQFEFRPQVRLTSRLNIGLSYIADDIDGLTVLRPDMPTDFVSHVVNARLDYSVSTKLLTTTMFQYNSLDRLQIIQFRVNRIFRMSDNIFISLNQTKYLGLDRTSRSIIVKTTYSFDY
jgi:hypothetical protein